MISELGGAAMHSGLQTRGLPGYRGRLTVEQIPRGGSPRGSLSHAAGLDRRAREHAQQRRRHGLAARRARGGRRGLARARAGGSSRRRAHRERRGRARRPGGADRGSVRHRDAVPLEGARLPARRRDRGLARSDGAGQGREAPLRRRDAAGRDRGRRGAVRPRAQRRAPRRRPRRVPGGSSTDGPSAACRSIPKRSRRTSSRSTSARSGSPRPQAIERLAAAGVGLSSTIRPGILRAVTHLDIDDAGDRRGDRGGSAGAGASCPRLASSSPARADASEAPGGGASAVGRCRRRARRRGDLVGRGRARRPRGGHRATPGIAVPRRLDHEDLHGRRDHAAARRGQARPRRPPRRASAGDRSRLADAEADARAHLRASARGRGRCS